MAEHLLHHRVAALHNFQAVGLVHLGAAVAVFGGHVGEGGEHVHLGGGSGGVLDGPHQGGRLLPHLAEELELQGADPVLGGEDLVLQVF